MSDYSVDDINDFLRLHLPSWLNEHDQPNFFENHYSYIYLAGGRASGKTYIVALYLLLQAISKPKQKILCTRQFQESLKKSVGACLLIMIHSLGLRKHFKITNAEFVYIPNGSEFLFKGFDRNKDTIKGYQDLTHVWIEEADSLTQESWDLLRPTVFRTTQSMFALFSEESYNAKPTESKAQIIITMNPKYETDCLYKSFILDKKTPPKSYIKTLNWYQNPFFNLSMHKERLHCLKNAPAVYNHIWEGELLQNSDAQVFKGKWFIQDFEEDENAEKYFGIDFGFVHPMAVIRCYIKDNCIYVTHEYKGVGIENHEIYDLCVQNIPGILNGKVYGDCARPDTITTLKRQGLYIKPCEKTSGDSKLSYTEDSISTMRSYKIIVKPSCINMISNLQLFSFKIEPRSGKITNVLIKENDDFIDALKYAVWPVIKQRKYDYSNYKYAV